MPSYCVFSFTSEQKTICPARILHCNTYSAFKAMCYNDFAHSIKFLFYAIKVYT